MDDLIERVKKTTAPDECLNLWEKIQILKSKYYCTYYHSFFTGFVSQEKFNVISNTCFSDGTQQQFLDLICACLSTSVSDVMLRCANAVTKLVRWKV